MPYRIKRTKAAPPGPLPAGPGSPPPAVHYALAADATGSVTGWTPDALAAGTFDEGTAAKVRANYKGRAHAGQLTVERLAEPKPPLAVEPAPAPAPAKPEPVPAAAPPPAPPKQPEQEKTSGRKAGK